jgi:hypothetical protein
MFVLSPSALGEREKGERKKRVFFGGLPTGAESIRDASPLQ